MCDIHRLWSKVTAAMLSRNLDLATAEKTAIEDHQRKLRASREAEHTEHTPKHFVCKNDTWFYVHEDDLIKQHPEKAVERVHELIFPNLQ